MFVGIETFDGDKRKQFNDFTYGEFPTTVIRSLFLKELREEGTGKRQKSPFWNWVNNISTELISPDPKIAFSHIAYSNLNKCISRKRNSGIPSERIFKDTNYQLNEDASRTCIRELRWIYREIQEIGAKNVIIFAGRGNDKFLAKLFLNMEKVQTFDYNGYNLSKETLEERNERDIFVHLRDGCRRIIVTNHPRGTPKLIRCKIVEIIKKNSWDNVIDWPLPS